jgi:hypothetical protein
VVFGPRARSSFAPLPPRATNSDIRWSRLPSSREARGTVHPKASHCPSLPARVAPPAYEGALASLRSPLCRWSLRRAARRWTRSEDRTRRSPWPRERAERPRQLPPTNGRRKPGPARRSRASRSSCRHPPAQRAGASPNAS